LILPGKLLRLLRPAVKKSKRFFVMVAWVEKDPKDSKKQVVHYGHYAKKFPLGDVDKTIQNFKDQFWATQRKLQLARGEPVERKGTKEVVISRPGG
jgi:hypothetical protein